MTSPFSPYEPPRADELSASTNGNSTTSRRASLWQRWAAAFIDAIVSSIIIFPLQYKAGVYDGFPTKVHPLTFAQSAMWGAIGFVLWFVIQGYFVSKSSQTIGKRALGIRIENRSDGAPAPFLKIVFVRYLPISLVALIPKVGPVLTLLDVLFIFRRDRRCLHDQLADTVVMKVD